GYESCHTFGSATKRPNCTMCLLVMSGFAADNRTWAPAALHAERGRRGEGLQLSRYSFLHRPGPSCLPSRGCRRRNVENRFPGNGGFRLGCGLLLRTTSST